MTTSNGLNNDMSQILQGLTAIVRFREIDVHLIKVSIQSSSIRLKYYNLTTGFSVDDSKKVEC